MDDVKSFGRGFTHRAGGFAYGLLQGVAPGGAIVGALPQPPVSREFQEGLGAGQIVGGAIQVVQGAGSIAGGVTCAVATAGGCAAVAVAPGAVALGAVQVASGSASIVQGVQTLQMSGKAPSVQQNQAKGKQFEQQTKKQLEKEGRTDIAEQVTVETPSGTRTRPDFLSKEKGVPKIDEAKGSATAQLTKNQKKAFPEIEQKGAVVVGKGKPGFPPGTKIPPTKPQIRRP